MNAIVAGQLKATTVPLRDDDDNNDYDSETAHTTLTHSSPLPPPPPIEKPAFPAPMASSFGGFGDFDLDLSCLSIKDVLPPPRTPSPPPTPILLSRSVSVVKQLRPLTKIPSKRQSSPLLPPMASLSLTRGTWPASSDFTGRGTPIDRTRRSEWGGILGEELSLGVGEDGVLLSSTAIASSFDSPKPTSHRSVSPDWNYISTSSAPASLSQKLGADEVPELAPIEIGALDVGRVDEWDSIMEAVLRPADVLAKEDVVLPEEKGKVEEVEVPPAPAPVPVAVEPPPEAPATAPAIAFPTLPEPEPVLDLQAGLDAALDMGLGLAGGRMNLFDLGLLPSMTGRDTPSIYSSQSHPARINGNGNHGTNGAGEAHTDGSGTASHSENRESSASVSGKIEGNGKSSRLGGKVVWRKMFGRICRLPSALHLQGAKGKH